MNEHERKSATIEGDYAIGIGRPLWLCRWWLRTRPCRKGIQLPMPRVIQIGRKLLIADKASIPPAVEFYVPWWAWLFELTHRFVFGKVTLKSE